jgi:drug/metabolite transporter (DMT)-like permease
MTIDSNLVGESAAILTSCLWTFNSLLFTSAGRKIGSLSVNAYRTIIAVGFLASAHVLFLGTLVPAATNEGWLWMGLSGIVGLGIGDIGLFAAFVIIGPRRSLLMMSLSPIFASIVAYLMLGEVISPLALIGIATTIAGVTLVILEKEESSIEDHIPKRLRNLGVILALVGAVGQGVGLVLSKKGIYLDATSVHNPLSATLIRMTVGALFVWSCALAAGRFSRLRQALNYRNAISHTAAGAFLGPFLGVTFSMVAVTYTKAGIAQTLMSLMPVLIIPVVWVLYKQRTNWRGVLGALIAVTGVAILMLI